MGKIAFVFAGQGAQHPGMGLELNNNFSAAAEVFRRLDEIRPGTSKECFFGDESALLETKNTQPCMFAVEMACAAVLKEHGVKADMAAGFSLGEIAALTYSGAVSIEDGFKLVCKRGELMQAAATKMDTKMVAVLKLSNEDVERLCAEYSGVYPVNYNCPGQVSVAGLSESMPDFLKALRAAGGRSVPLKVNAGFHSPFMADAASEYLKELSAYNLNTPTIPLYSNVTGMPYGENMKELLAKQISSPVLFEKIVRNMIKEGADTFIELGPGQTLCGLIQKIDPSVRAFGFSDQAGLDAILSEVL